MTILREELVFKYKGISTDTKPKFITESGGGSYVPVGSEFMELDTGKIYYADGAGTWYQIGDVVGSTSIVYVASATSDKNYYLGTRTSIEITTTSSHLFSGGALSMSGDLLRQYTIQLGDSTGDPTRTVSLVDSNSITVWQSTAITDSTSITRLLPTSEQVVLTGSYTVVWTLSTNSPTTGIFDYFTFGFERG